MPCHHLMGQWGRICVSHQWSLCRPITLNYLLNEGVLVYPELLKAKTLSEGPQQWGVTRWPQIPGCCPQVHPGFSGIGRDLQKSAVLAGQDWVEDTRMTRMIKDAQVRRGRGPSWPPPLKLLKRLSVLWFIPAWYGSEFFKSELHNQTEWWSFSQSKGGCLERG